MSELDQTSEIERIQQALHRATEAIKPGGDPFEVFPNPRDKERSADIVWGANLSTEQEEGFRAAMAEIGPGRTHNVGAEHWGLEDNNFVALTEGGQPHKMIAELNVLLGSDDDHPVATRPAAYVVSGSPDRDLNETEQAISKALLGVAGKNEQEVAELAVSTRSEFTPVEPVALHDGIKWSMTWFGMLDGRPVYSMGIKRLDPDGEKQPKVTTKEKMEIVSEIVDGIPVAFATGATTVPSAEVAAHDSDVEVFVLSYGIEELAKVKGTDPIPPAINQLGAEAYKTAAFLAGKK